MKHRTQAILAATAVAAFFSLARPAAAQDFRDGTHSGWRSREGSRRGELRSFHGDRFRSRDGWRGHGYYGSGYYGGYVAPYPVYGGYVAPYDGYYAYAPGYAAPPYPYSYGPRVTIRLPVPHLHLPLPFFRFHHH